MPARYLDDVVGNDLNSGLVGFPWKTKTPVNAFTWTASDGLVITSGQSFAGPLIFTTPIGYVTTSGASKPTISAGNGYGILCQDISNVLLYNLKAFGVTITFSGTFPTKTATCTNVAVGFAFYNSAVNAYMSNLSVIDCEADGFNQGMTFSTINAGSPVKGFDTVLVSGTSVHDCLLHGMGHAVPGGSGFVAQSGARTVNFVTTTTRVYNIYGNDGNSAYPFSLTNLGSGSRINQSVMHHAGECSNRGGGGNLMAVVAVECNGLIVEDCEAYEIRTPNGVDGGAWDWDSGCRNCTFRRCYAHDMDGPAIEGGDAGTGTTWGNNSWEFCVSERCGRNGSNGGIRTFSSGLAGFRVVHCAIAHSTTASPMHSADSVISINNAFYVFGASVTFGAFTNIVQLVGSGYQAAGGASFSLTIDGAAKASLAAIRAAGYESHAAVNYGFSGTLGLADPGNGTTRWPSPVTTLSAYNITAAAGMLGAGIDPALVGSTVTATSDFHNFSFTDSVALSGWTPGACQIGNIAGVGTAGWRSC